MICLYPAQVTHATPPRVLAVGRKAPAASLIHTLSSGDARHMDSSYISFSTCSVISVTALHRWSCSREPVSCLHLPGLT